MTTRTDVVFDTNVWVALFRKELHPARLRRHAEYDRVLVPPVVMAEIGALVARRTIRASGRKIVERFGVPIRLGADEAWAAGRRLGQWTRGGGRRGGLADALILEAARSRGATLLTFDDDFRGEPDVRILREERK